jgi:hypothetical protein
LRRREIVAGLAVVSCLTTAAAAIGQEKTGAITPPQIERFVLRPSLSITDMGLDTNVLTTASGQQRDRTANLRVQIEPSLRFGPARLSGTLGTRLSYFQVHDRERSFDADGAARIDVNAPGAAAYALASFVRAHDPFDPEVYARTRRVQQLYEGGATIRLTGKTSAGFTAQRSAMSLEADDVGLDEGLSPQFVRHTDALTGSVRDAITPLTSVSLTGGIRREHVSAPAAATATSISVMAGLDTAPEALLGGKAYIGYRHFQPGAHAHSPEAAMIGSLDLGFFVTDSIRVGALADRDVSRSFRIAETYVTSARLGATVTRRMTRAWTLRAESSRQWLAYDTVAGTTAMGASAAALETAIDRMSRYTAVADVQLSRGTSLALTADYSALRAHSTGRRYDRLRLVSSITHRF